MRDAWRTLSVVSLASVTTALGGNALNVALPVVVRHFEASTLAANWILLSFLLAHTIMMVVFGRLADMFGRRAMYLYGLGIYTGASLLLGLAPDVWVLVGLRMVQAAGAAMLLANSAALVSDAFPRERLGQGLGVYTAAFFIAQLLAPPLGGLLADGLGWRWVFWFNVPLGLLCLAWSALALRPTAPAPGERGLDVTGNLLVAIALGALLLALSQVSEGGWARPGVAIGLAGFALLLPVFLAVETRVRHPVVDLTLFRDRAFTYGMAAGFLSAVARMGIMPLVALYYQAVAGDTPTEAGLKVLPLPIATVIASIGSGFLHRYVRPRTLAVVGSATTALGLAMLLAAISPTADLVALAVALGVVGLGAGIFLPSNSTALLEGLATERLGIVNALRLMLQSTGVVLSTALAFSIVTTALAPPLRRHIFAGTIGGVSRQAVVDVVTGYRWALACLLAVSVVAVLACLAGRGTEPARR